MARASAPDAAVAQVLAACPPTQRRRLHKLRTLIFETAAATEGVGEIEETLKWGEPAYLTPHSKSGSTIRIGWKPSRPNQVAMYFHCQTDLVQTFRTLFAQELKFEGKRAIVFDDGDAMPADALAVCIRAALTYHLRRRSAR